MYLKGKTMGTTYNITLVKQVNFIDLTSIKLAIDNRLNTISSIFSTYIRTSQVSQFNELKVAQKLKVSPLFIQLFKLAKRINQLSQGAYDITIMPLVRLWGFASSNRNKMLDNVIKKNIYEKYLKRNKISLGMQFVRHDKKYIWKTHENIELDFSSIAKGYAVDEVANILNTFNIKNYFVEIGGEVKVKGFNEKNSVWRLGIENPNMESIVGHQGVFAITSLKSNAMATSGNYRNFTFIDGNNYSHIIDARSKWPVQNSVLSVTVVGKSCSIIDALATTFMVLGFEKTKKMALQSKIGVLSH